MLDDGRVNFWMRRWLTSTPAPRKYLVQWKHITTKMQKYKCEYFAHLVVPWVVDLNEAAANPLPWLHMLTGALARVLTNVKYNFL